MRQSIRDVLIAIMLKTPDGDKGVAGLDQL
jgi:hypothetical protein